MTFSFIAQADLRCAGVRRRYTNEKVAARAVWGVFAGQRACMEPPVGIEPTTFSLRETTKRSPWRCARLRCNSCIA